MIDAGRYLNDNEFCYLGTVIVTADVDDTKHTGHRTATKNEKVHLNPVLVINSRSI